MAGELTPASVLAEVDRIMSARWKWGHADCCTAASDVFNALHGIDPMSPVRGAYDSLGGAARLIRNWGGFVSMAEQMARIAGLTVSAGQPGDIGLSPPGTADGPERRALLICIQPGHWAAKTGLGYEIQPTAERCWCA